MFRRAAAWTMTAALVIGGMSATESAASAAETVPQSASGVSASNASVADSVVKTADLSKFQAGNIISDAAFFNAGTMSEAQIQSFLQAKVPTCQSGYVCLKDWYDTSRTTAADAMCGAYSGGVRERASTIIFKVAQACGINPQVLLVMLQKEQGLVTHVWPSDWRYTIAMGQGCPDTAACDTRYYGFFNQVYGAAWQMKRYANPAGTSQYFTWYAPGKTWNLRWHPNEACGSAPVYVQNQATANLYYYTPYQPNAAAIRAGYGEGDGCSSYGNRNFYQYFTDWFGPAVPAALAVGSPIGNFEILEAAPGDFRVAGWAADPDTKDPIQVHVYINGVGTPLIAGQSRPDVGAAYPALGSLHGFDVRLPAQGAGATNVCAYAINVSSGDNALLGCRTATAMSGSPVGAVDSLKGVDGGIELGGWAIDPDLTGSIEVHAYVDGSGTPLVANGNRSDLVPHYPAYGAAHGYTAKIAAGIGVHTVCLYAINVKAGSNTTLTCSQVTVSSGPDLGRSPTGNYETLSVDGTTATVAGWALDPDTTEPIKVHIYVGSAGAEYTADQARPDVGNAFPGYGAGHGFSEQVQLPLGRSTVCAYAINTTVAGPHVLLGCRTADVSTSTRPPIGNYETLVPQAGGATVSGWALDPDTTNPITVHIYVDSVRTEAIADDLRPDVAAAFPGRGDRHGYAEVIPMTSGAHRVCVWAINDGAGINITLGCRDVVVP